MVISSSSNAGVGAEADVLTDAVAFGLTALTVANPTPPTTLLLTKFLRFIFFLVNEDDGPITFYCRVREKSNANFFLSRQGHATAQSAVETIAL